MRTSRRRATTTATVAAVLAVLFGLGACAAATGNPDPTVQGGSSTPAAASDIDSASIGLEWHTVELSGPLDGDTNYESFGAGDSLWLYQQDLPTTLHTTSDGATWRTIDLTRSGLPADATILRGIEGVIVDWTDGLTTILYTTYTNGSHPAALDTIQWLVEVTPTAVTVTPGGEVGLESMPANEGGFAFRTGTIAAFARLGETRLAVGDGQWWQPGLTSRYDGFVALEGPSGWQVLSSEAALPFGVDPRNIVPIALATVGDRLVMLGSELGNAYPFVAFTSADGRTWKDTTTSFDEAIGAKYRVYSVAVGAGGMVAIGIEADNLMMGTGPVVVWASADGTTWTRSALPVTDGSAVVVIDRGIDYLAIVESDYTALAFSSPDGVAWTLSDIELPYAATFAVEVGDGLVAQYTSGMVVSGLDWGLTP